MSNIPYPPQPWQRASWEHLLQLKAQDRIPHALLLTGKAGVDKLEFAKAFAQLLLCSQPLEHSPCCECKNCLLFQSEDGHPDLMLIEPEGKLGIIKIEQVREAIEKVVQTSQQGGYRVMIIQEAHAMNIASANALLKSLEEPGALCVFIVLSDKPHLLLPTIKSRCQMVNLSVDPNELLDTETLEKQQQWIGKLLSDAEPLSLAQEYGQADLPQLLNWLNAVLADCIKLASFAKLPLAFPDYHLQMTQMAAGIPIDRLYKLLDKSYQLTAQAQLKISLNQQLILEDLLIEWNQVFFLETVS